MKSNDKIVLRLPRRTSPQKKFDQSLARFNLSLWGRQSGKTTIGYRKLVWKPLQSPWQKWSTYWHVLQTISAAEIVFERYLRFIHPFKSQLLKYKSETERRVELVGKNNIFFKSGQNFEDLRTESLNGAVIDEARQQHKDLWTMVVFPMLAKSKGWADIMSSPNGFDWLYDLKNTHATDPDWNIIHAPSWEAWWWTPEEIATAKRTMTELEFRQELGAEFINLRTGKVYYAWGEHNHARECPFMVGKLWSPYHSAVLGADFNLNPMAWTLGQNAAEKWWWFDELHLQNSNTPEAAEALAVKIMAMKAAGYRAEPNLIICGDATGKATQRTSNQSDYDILKAVLKKHNISFRDETPAANPSIKDRTNSVNLKCKNALGEVEMWVHPDTCPELCKDMDRTGWKQGADFVEDPGPQKDRGHAASGIGYAIHKITPPKLIREIAKQRVIQRVL